MLDRNIFNETLYSRMRDFWFEGLPEGASTAPSELFKRWWKVKATPEQSARFDGECDENFGHALDALSPDKLVLPAFESYEKDVEDADAIAAPFLKEVKEAQAQDAKKGSDTLLSLILLLDQMSRNIYRDPAGLRLVFQHFDRLAHTLVRASMRLSPNPVEYEGYSHRPVFQTWFLMPLMHSEHLQSHELFEKVLMACRRNVEATGDQPALESIDNSLKFERAHVKPLKKFGRYPHRNAALGRQSTKEEEEELKSGETFGVKQETKEKGQEKSEL
jgi:uncharacterized protein (DUF924 family)